MKCGFGEFDFAFLVAWLLRKWGKRGEIGKFWCLLGLFLIWFLEGNRNLYSTRSASSNEVI